MIINKHDNKKKEIKTGIPQGLPISLILFLIYISRIYDVIEENNPTVTSLLFVDDLGFIASSNSIKEISQALGKVASTVLHWGSINAVTYDTSKTKSVLFSKSHHQ